MSPSHVRAANRTVGPRTTVIAAPRPHAPCAALAQNVARGKAILDAITDSEIETYETWFVIFPRASTSPYYEWVEKLKLELPEEQRALYGCRTGWSAPFVWLERPDGTRSWCCGGEDGRAHRKAREGDGWRRWLEDNQLRLNSGSFHTMIITINKLHPRVCRVFGPFLHRPEVWCGCERIIG